MKKAWKISSVVIGAAAAVFLVGSFPVKYYYGQYYCDLMRVIGFILLFIYLGMLLLMKEREKKNR